MDTSARPRPTLAPTSWASTTCTRDAAVATRSVDADRGRHRRHRTEMRRDARVFYIGQDIGAMGGSLQGTQGLLAEFGPRRIREAPISESAMVGAAIGAAMFGQRPIVEISFGEFLPAAMNQLVNQAPNMHYMTGGVARVPVVIRTRVGDGPYGGHPQDYSAWFAHVPGLKVVMPGHPADARGLMLAPSATTIRCCSSSRWRWRTRRARWCRDAMSACRLAVRASPGRDET